MDLFSENSRDDGRSAPLAWRMCPREISEFKGQEHIVSEGKLLRRAIESDRISSLIFYGPPGVGKTALAMVISARTGGEFHRKNAVSSNVQEMREIIKKARQNKEYAGKKTILLLDEIHRFTKAQQDVLLPEVEQGVIILIGTTTENPYFSVNSALLSRSQVFEFKPLAEEHILRLLKEAALDKERGLGGDVVLTEEAAEHLARLSDGDARKALSALEIAALTTAGDDTGKVRITLKEAEDSIQRKAVVYDRDGDQHYDTASAYIKAMRGSDPDAALYWLAKMIHAGEDVRFIARRMAICAAEDVGLADPRALTMAASCVQICEFIGMPEARIPLAEVTVYIASAPKSNSAYLAIDKALAFVENERTREVPDHLKDAHYPGAKSLGRGEGYKYAHSYENGYVRQEYMPGKERFYVPLERGYEKKIAEWLAKLKGNS